VFKVPANTGTSVGLPDIRVESCSDCFIYLLCPARWGCCGSGVTLFSDVGRLGTGALTHTHLSPVPHPVVAVSPKGSHGRWVFVCLFVCLWRGGELHRW
jgi:hypothetical protein